MALPAPVDFRALFEKSPGNFLILDPEFRIVAVSDGYCRVTGMDRDGALGHLVFDVLTGDPSPPDTEASRNCPERDQNIAIRRLRAANEELAQLESLRAGLVHMSRLNTIAMMASALAHDVSQPLTAARNYLSALRRGASAFDTEKSEEILSKLSLQIDRASEIVKGLRTFMVAGSTVHRPEDVATVICEAARLAGAVVKAVGARLTVRTGTALPRVSMDRLQIQQCLLNLVTNAAEAMRGSLRREIDITATATHAALRIEVSDTGPGLPADVAMRLHEPFATTGCINMGLGLPICCQIVKEHHGVFSVATKEPAGTVIAFTIPFGSGTPS